VAKKPATVSRRQGTSVVLDDRRRLGGAWQDRIRDPSLTALLVLELGAIFFAGPLAARGLPIARAVADTLVLAALVIVVMLSPRWDTIILILLGLTATAASFLLSGEWSPVSTIVLRRGGNILAFSALSWVVARAVYAPGRITLRRLQGAVVLYLSLSTIFASAYGLMWSLAPAPSSMSSPRWAARRKSRPCCISALPR
jgi:hypothetical protein